MTTTTSAPKVKTPVTDERDPLVRARREKLQRWRETYGITGYGHRVDDLQSLADARATFDQSAHDAFEAAKEAAAEGDAPADGRPRVRVAGRCIQHRAMGKLVFLVLRDHTGDLQVSASKADVEGHGFKLAQKLDYGDIVVAEGPMGMTKKGEICVWADKFDVHAKALVPPPEKFHGLTDAELRYRRRYVDMFSNPQTMRTMIARSQIVSMSRRFMESRKFLEVETPMMQPMAGGAAARPFTTHHNALSMPLFMRIAPELYLKRLLVGGMPRVYEINRNFRNEGIDRQHNPEFTMMEVYEAFGDCWTMLELTESLIRHLAAELPRVDLDEDDPAARLVRPFGDLEIDYGPAFERVRYGDLFESALGFPMTDEAKVRAKATADRIENAAKVDVWLLVDQLFERHAEHHIDPLRPTFVTDYPSAISPLTRPHPEAPELSYRWELFLAGMELANSYTELNDPDVQRAKFSEQLQGADEEVQAFRTLDEDFLYSLNVGMPPAGGLGVGIDRIVMLLTGSTTIRDVILFPLMKPEGAGDEAAEGDASDA